MMRRALAAAAGLVLLSVTLAGCTPPTSFIVEDVVTGLDQPWDIGFTPDGTMMYTIKGTIPGTINAFVEGTDRILAAPADSVSYGEGGMLGMAIDPGFAANRRIYTCFLSNLGVYNGRDVRVVRWEVDPTYTTLTNRADIVIGIQPSNGFTTGKHSGCRPRFGPDGHLYIGTGDGARGTNPQDKASLSGKVLRVDTNGQGVAGNPGVVDAGSGFDPRIFTYGHRNIQGIAFRPSDGQPFDIEHGPECDDEVNLLVAGGNYGWDPVPGYTQTVPMTDLVKFPDAHPAVWSSGCPTIAPSGATFVLGDQWGSWQNHLVMAVLKGEQLRTIRIGLDDEVVEEIPFVTDQDRLRSAVQGPDGNLYVAVDLEAGKIFRVTPVR